VNTATLRMRRAMPVIALLGVSALALSACAPEASEVGGLGSPDFTYFGQTQNSTIVGTLESLSKDQCTAENTTAPLKADAVDGTTWDQQLQLLAGQDALSNISMAAGTPSLMKQFIDAGQVVDLGTELDALGVHDQILPAAESTLNALYGEDSLYALPTEFNIEGFWYNKQLLADNGVQPPATWSELTAAAATLKAAGVQPFIAAGKDGWPVTRLVGDYIMRDLGPDALQAVADGSASLTDAEYVRGADAIAELGTNGYFGKAAGSVDYTGAMNQFLTGGGAFFYMGSWALANFNDDTQNQIGADNIGFLPFPSVDGGAGSSDQVPANAGIPVMLTTVNYGTNQSAWLKCIAENYGDQALNEFGQVTGFKVSGDAEVSPLTATVQDVIANAPSSVLWFEAKFSPEGTTVSQTNGGGLATGTLTGAEFMKLVQDANNG
jgi:raffinose/stachyose/melibiose transport system substrate-binding protein